MEYCTVKEAANILGIAVTRAYELGYEEKLTRYKKKGKVFYDRVEVVKRARKTGQNKGRSRPALEALGKKTPYPKTGSAETDKLLGGSSQVGEITPRLPDTRGASPSVVTLVTPSGYKIIGNIPDVANFYNYINKIQ